MLAPEITNHIQQALARLMYQYQGLPRIQGFYAGFVQQVQDLEDAIFNLDAQRQLWDGTSTPAFGKQLDNIGTIVGISRNGLPDDEYLLFIFGKIAENNSDDTLAAVLSVIGYIFQAEQTLVQEIFPAALCVEVLNPAIPQRLYSIAVSLVQNALGAGIKLIISSWTNTNVFRFAGSGVGPQNGFGDVNTPGSGGVFVGLIS